MRIVGRGKHTLSLGFAVMIAAGACTQPAQSDTASAVTSPTASAEATASAGLPSGLENRSWVGEIDFMTFGAATLDGRSSMLLPSGETGLTANDGLVVSVQYLSDQPGSIVRVRDIATGEAKLELTRAENVVVAVLHGGRLYFSGHVTSATPTDPGVHSVAVDGGRVETLLPEVQLPEDWGLATRALELSPTGKTLAASLCGDAGCRVDVVDVDSNSVRATLPRIDGVLRDTTDDVVVAGDQVGVAGYDSSSGAVVWKVADGEYQSGYVTNDGQLIQAVMIAASDGPTFTIQAIHVSDGAVRVLYSETVSGRAVGLWTEISGDHYAVLGSGSSLGAVFTQGNDAAPIDLLDLATGEVIKDRVVIEVPK